MIAGRLFNAVKKELRTPDAGTRKLQRVYLTALGCRLNTAEIEELARRFVGAGYLMVAEPEQADLLLLNTCAVTARAASESRNRLRKLHRINPQAEIAALGCWITGEPAAARDYPGVKWAISNADKMRAVQIITGQAAPLAPWTPDIWPRTRVFLGVQDGCDYHCTYCVTRILRGAARSRPLPEVLALVQELAEGGAREVVLTGVSLGSYGAEWGLEEGLATLVAALLHETELPRLRLSSLEPWDVSEQLLRQWENPRLCRQLHVPLQAGADGTLRRMGRQITTAEFAGMVARAREIAPGMAVTTDMLVGFPGETAADFQASLAFVAEMGFARLHVFPYSEREGTPAVSLPGSVPTRLRRERAARMRQLGRRLAAAFRERFIGQTVPVLWEHRGSDGLWRGWTDNYLGVVAQSPAQLHNRITPVRLVARQGERLRGELAWGSNEQQSGLGGGREKQLGSSDGSLTPQAPIPNPPIS
ncbi:MAG: MiaB/RimO family radical SAM methylthiotransferase [Chloroflexota bacterium]|nr:MiaB/RimO family radical SAM methylthiotransferase [Chloroflexota bacterium]